jgi:predicted permease
VSRKDRRKLPQAIGTMSISLIRDAGHALRLLLKQKSFAFAALLTLALCTGANTAVFSVVNSLLLRPLPFEGSERLVHVYNSYPRAGAERGGASIPDYYERRELDAFEHVAMLQERGLTVGESGRPERVRGRAVTPSFFAMLGVEPVAGRTFLEEEGEPGNDLQAVLSWRFWQDRYAGSADVIGRSIRIDDVAHTIVGIMPRGFVFSDADEQLWVPLSFPVDRRGDDARHNNNWSMIAKLRPGVSLAQAQQQIDALNARADERLPQFRDLLRQVGFVTVVADYRADIVRDVRDTLWLLQAGVVFVLIIGCVNIANLVLVRATARHRELATRAALGAGRGRLVRQLLTENIVLALGGGLLGVFVGWAAVRAFATYAVEYLPRGSEIGFDATTLLVSFLTAVAAGALFGALPVLRLLRADLSSIFRDESRASTAGRRTHAWRAGLVVTQVSLAFALLVGAGLLITSFSRTLSIHPGFESGNVFTAAVSLPVTRYADAAARRQFTQALLERVRALPGVVEAGVTNTLPFGNESNASAVTFEGHVPEPDDAVVAPTIAHVSAGYFEAMRIRVSGRTFAAGDGDGALDVAIVDRTLAERFWPGEDPIGRRVAQGLVVDGEDDLRYATVVGLSEPTRTRELTERDPVGTVYFAAAQRPVARFFLVAKTSIPPSGITAGVRAAILELDADMPLYDVRSMDEWLARSLATARFRTQLIAAFGFLALLLSAIGIYGVLAYAVAQRSAEIGIRMALGSSERAIFGMVLRQGLRLLAAGLLVGAVGSLALGRAVRSMLYGVEPTDPLVLAVVLAVLAATALAACALPARRAMRIDPLAAIRGSE